MNIAQFKPFKEMEEFFGRFRPSWDSDFPLQSMTHSDWIPAVDVTESDDEYLLTVEIPQVEKKDVHVQVQDHLLNIDGERKYENEDKKAHRIERYYGSFHRTFRLPDDVLEDKIHADHKNGCLYIALPKSDVAKPKQLEVEIH